MLLLQGLNDSIVPPAQSEAIAADLAAYGIPHDYLAFEGELHGFCKAETVIARLRAELAFYGEVFWFTPPGVAPIKPSQPSRDQPSLWILTTERVIRCRCQPRQLPPQRARCPSR